MKSFKNYRKLQKIKDLAKDADLDISKFKDEELIKGFDTEKEHQKIKKLDVVKGDEANILKIALAHLDEDPHYYEKLTKAKL